MYNEKMVKVYLKNLTSYDFKYEKIFQKITKNIISNENIKTRTEVNIIIIDNHAMKKLSNQYRNQDEATDILSFPNNYKELFAIIKYNMIGDIYISYEKILEQAKNLNHSSKREWTYIFAHGLLHLLGYDHKKESEAKIMNSKIKKTLVDLGVINND